MTEQEHPPDWLDNPWVIFLVAAAAIIWLVLELFGWPSENKNEGPETTPTHHRGETLPVHQFRAPVKSASFPISEWGRTGRNYSLFKNPAGTEASALRLIIEQQP